MLWFITVVSIFNIFFYLLWIPLITTLFGYYSDNYFLDKIAEFKDLIDVAFIYNCTEPLPSEKIKRSKKYGDYNPNTDVTTVPIFVLRKCRGSDNPCRIFVDDCGRIYKTWEDYLVRNKLPECHMTVPLNGRLVVIHTYIYVIIIIHVILITIL